MQVTSQPKTTIEQHVKLIQTIGLADYLNVVGDAIFAFENDVDLITKARLEEIVNFLESATSVARDVNLE